MLGLMQGRTGSALHHGMAVRWTSLICIFNVLYFNVSKLEAEYRSYDLSSEINCAYITVIFDQIGPPAKPYHVHALHHRNSC